MADATEQARLDAIHAASTKLQEMHDRIHKTYLQRDRGPEQREIWSTACAEFHRRYPDLHFPGGSEVIDRAKQGTPDGIVNAIDFLVADPMHFRSGYLKQDLWHWSKRWALLPSDIARLERAALVNLQRAISREFREMCCAMAKHGTAAFWSEVERTASSEDAQLAKRATLLRDFRVSAAHGGQKFRAFIRESFDRRARARMREGG